jgi:hypothetical protein
MRSVRALTFDAGALIAAERSDRRMTSLLSQVLVDQTIIAVPTGVIAQVWRGGMRQARLARLLSDPAVEVVPLDDERARAVGILCGRTRTSDVIDASVVLCAREHGRAPIVTSDPEDLRRLDPGARLIVV